MKFFLFLFFVSFSSLCRAEIVDRIVAVVNDDIVTLSEVKNFHKKLKSNGLIDEALLNLYDRKKLLSDQKTLVEYLIDEKTIDSEIRKQGIVAPIEQVEAEIRNIARARGIDRSQLKLALKKEGIAYSDYQDFMKTSLQRQTLIQKEVTSKIKISDDEVNSYYIQNSPHSKALVYEYTLAHILFLNSNGGQEKAHKRALEVKGKLDQGIPFETLASKYSEDPNFVQGGLFGTFRISDFNKDVEKAISGLEVSEITTPLRMPDGFHIFKVLKKTLVPSPDLEARREEIRRVLLAGSFKRQFRSWLDEKRRNSHIRVNDPSATMKK